MTYRELLLQAELKLDHNDITLGEFEQMIAPLNREVDVLDKIRAEIDEIQLSEPIMSTDGLYCYGSKSISMGHFREKVIDIIDKYREGSE